MMTTMPLAFKEPWWLRETQHRRLRKPIHLGNDVVLHSRSTGV